MESFQTEPYIEEKGAKGHSMRVHFRKAVSPPFQRQLRDRFPCERVFRPVQGKSPRGHCLVLLFFCFGESRSQFCFSFVTTFCVGIYGDAHPSHAGHDFCSHLCCPNSVSPSRDLLFLITLVWFGDGATPAFFVF